MFRFPWSNFHELNLDWILEVVKEAKEIFVNGRSDIDNAVETANEALEVAEQAAAAVIADGAITIPKLNNEVLKTTAYVIVGNRADDPVPAGAYVYLRKSLVAGLSDGIYIAASNIPADSIVTPAEFQQPTELHDAGALNVLNNTLSQLGTDVDAVKTNVGKILPVITGSTNNSGYTINTGDDFIANGSFYKANASIPINGAWSSSATAQTDTAVNDLQHSLMKYSFYNSGDQKIVSSLRCPCFFETTTELRVIIFLDKPVAVGVSASYNPVVVEVYLAGTDVVHQIANYTKDVTVVGDGTQIQVKITGNFGTPQTKTPGIAIFSGAPQMSFT